MNKNNNTKKVELLHIQHHKGLSEDFSKYINKKENSDVKIIVNYRNFQTQFFGHKIILSTRRFET